jgi:PIN domain nuclease of toxin-antitoxin system
LISPGGGSQALFKDDPFDRVIASQATLRGATLLTKNRTLLTHCEWADWPD